MIIFLGGGDGSVTERRACDRKFADSNPGRSGGRSFFSSVNFLCRLLFRYWFHPRATAITHVRDPGHSAKSAGGWLQLNTNAPYVCGFAWSDNVNWCMAKGCMMYTERTLRRQF